LPHRHLKISLQKCAAQELRKPAIIRLEEQACSKSEPFKYFNVTQASLQSPLFVPLQATTPRRRFE